MGTHTECESDCETIPDNKGAPLEGQSSCDIPGANVQVWTVFLCKVRCNFEATERCIVRWLSERQEEAYAMSPSASKMDKDTDSFVTAS